jgi:hypothetical protein
MTVIIDFHTHVAPPEVRDRPVWKGKCPMTIENVLDAQTIAGIDRCVYRKPKRERSGDEARQGSRVNQ